MWDSNLSLVFGRVFKMILSSMLNFAEIPKFHLYSCHDSTLMLLLYGLGCFDGQWPPFSADVILELYVDEPNFVSASSETESSRQSTSPATLNGLWIRVLYMGRPISLGCVWKVPYEDGDRYNEGYVPLHFLFERWKSDAPSLGKRV
ncbi:unnamed protein product [Dicrocoelium dendriticum]|nr:unnamed protein product [Dicrocoelium dendriticum]